jgi:selenide,water dikinase
VVRGLPQFNDPNLLIGPEQFSDAGVYRVSDDLAIVQTVDFFPPLVDDPRAFGQIAAANALSDVYAMGGQPRTALNIVGFPDKDAPLELLHEILAGGADKVAEAGAVVVGGHSVRDAEIKYGLAITGFVDPRKMMSNRDARPGDALVLTKALGTSFVVTANRAGTCPPETLNAAVASMTQLNKAASEIAMELGARAATDITGFGLAGHAIELADASGVTLTIELSKLPLLPGAEELARAGNRSRANASNREYTAARTRVAPGADPVRLEFCFDPQTSGGLLVALPQQRAAELVKRCHTSASTVACVIGSVDEKSDVSMQLIR